MRYFKAVKVYSRRMFLLRCALKSIYSFADIDECATVNECSANSNCTNTDGSYKCECPPGYMLLTDQRTCEGKLFSLSHLCAFCLCSQAVVTLPKCLSTVFAEVCWSASKEN